jgi:hypothetical protein
VESVARKRLFLGGVWAGNIRGEAGISDKTLSSRQRVEMGAATIRRATAVHPLSDLQISERGSPRHA